MINQAVILAGGKGNRLKPITDKLPKPMAPIKNKPFMDYLIKSVVDVGINNILILTGYKAQIIEKRYGCMKNINIKFHRGKINDKTGARLINAFHLLDNNFLLLYGDNYWPIELIKMKENFIKSNSDVCTTVFSNKKGTGEYGIENNIAVDKNGLVIFYDKKRNSKRTNGVDIGYFIINKNILKNIKLDNPSFEVDVLPKLIIKNNLHAYITDRQYYYITDVNSLKDFSIIVKNKNYKPLEEKYFGK